eukprot:g5543.t1
MLVAAATLGVGLASAFVVHNVDQVCGTWQEKGPCSASSKCGTQYLRDTITFDGNLYSRTINQFAGQTCELSSTDISITSQGKWNIFGVPAATHAWSHVVFEPESYTILVEDENANFEFNGRCQNALQALNTYCGCGGNWESGNKRTVYLNVCRSRCTLLMDKLYSNMQYYNAKSGMEWITLTKVEGVIQNSYNDISPRERLERIEKCEDDQILPNAPIKNDERRQDLSNKVQNLKDRKQNLEEWEQGLGEKEEALEEQEKQLEEREKALEEQQKLETEREEAETVREEAETEREAIEDAREADNDKKQAALEELKEELDEYAEQLNARAEALDQREEELDQREQELEQQTRALSEREQAELEREHAEDEREAAEDAREAAQDEREKDFMKEKQAFLKEKLRWEIDHNAPVRTTVDKAQNVVNSAQKRVDERAAEREDRQEARDAEEEEAQHEHGQAERREEHPDIFRLLVSGRHGPTKA